jgi:hypothetical protein
LLRGEEWSTWKREFYGFVCNCCQLSLISRVGCNLISDDDFTSSIIYSCKHVFNSKRPLAATHVSLFCRVAPIQTYISSHLFSFLFYQNGCSDQFARTSTNPTGPEVNNYASLQWPWGLWDSSWWPLRSKSRV